MRRYDLSIAIGYHQLIIADSIDEKQSLARSWQTTEHDHRIRLKSLTEVVVVYTARDGMMPVAVEMHDIDPGVDLAQWDHVVECGLYVPSKCINIMALESSQPYAELKMEFTDYRLRMHQGNLDTISDDESEGKEHYLLTLWPSSEKGLVVLKQYEYSR